MNGFRGIDPAIGFVVGCFVVWRGGEVRNYPKSFGVEMGATDIIHSAAELMHLRGLRIYTTMTTSEAFKLYNVYSDLNEFARRQRNIHKDE